MSSLCKEGNYHVSVSFPHYVTWLINIICVMFPLSHVAD